MVVIVVRKGFCISKTSAKNVVEFVSFYKTLFLCHIVIFSCFFAVNLVIAKIKFIPEMLNFNIESGKTS